jgi:hypothetical protein
MSSPRISTGTSPWLSTLGGMGRTDIEAAAKEKTSSAGTVAAIGSGVSSMMIFSLAAAFAAAG